jgi:hypothetical protein
MKALFILLFSFSVSASEYIVCDNHTCEKKGVYKVSINKKLRLKDVSVSQCLLDLKTSNVYYVKQKIHKQLTTYLNLERVYLRQEDISDFKIVNCGEFIKEPLHLDCIGKISSNPRRIYCYIK